MKLIYMVVLLAYQMILIGIRKQGLNSFFRDDTTDLIIKIIPIAICIIGALGE